MKEDFLHALWQMQYYDRPVVTSCGMEVIVVKPGIHNRADGPDFQQAKIVMDALEWNGSVEIHVRASEWIQHKHHHDPAYDSVILHVVWEQDQPVFRIDGSRIPTVELRNYIPLPLLLRYRSLASTGKKLPCSAMLPLIPEVIITSMLDSVLAERLSRRADELLIKHKAMGFDWLRTAASWLARCMGMPGNEDGMEWLVQNLPVQMLQEEGRLSVQLAALLNWLAGFREQSAGEHIPALASGLNLTSLPMLWRNSGCRPISFPGTRVKQLAFILPVLSDWIQQEKWSDFFLFLDSRGFRAGNTLKNHLRINFYAPLLAAQARHKCDHSDWEKISDELHQLEPEQNRITRKMQDAGFKFHSAADTQALKELHDYWCTQKRCMQCRIGIAVLGRVI